MDETKIHTTPKDFFLWVGVIVALYVSAISLLALLFEYIDIIFVSSFNTFQYSYSGAIRISIASLIVIFPIYLYLTHIINKDIRKDSRKREVGVRRWLIFLTLFVSGITVIVDLIVLINRFLGGEELTYSFILKVLSILIVIGGVFLYYIYDLRGKLEDSKVTSQIIFWTVSIIVISSIVGGFFIMGSPQTQRLIRLDRGKIDNLSGIQWQITNFYQQKGRLPNTLEELKDPLVGFITPKDSQTGKEYGYVLADGLKFYLCADFNKESRGFNKKQTKSNGIRSSIKYNSGYSTDGENWAHSEGEVCFERTIDPDKFPQIKRAIQ